MSIGLIADFPGSTVALFTNIFFYDRIDQADSNSHNKANTKIF